MLCKQFLSLLAESFIFINRPKFSIKWYTVIRQIFIDAFG
jgi:hypothetical protein